MTAPREQRHLLDDKQTAELDTFVSALRGLSALASDGSLAGGNVEIPRHELAAIFDVLEARIDAIRGHGKLPWMFVDAEELGAKAH